MINNRTEGAIALRGGAFAGLVGGALLTVFMLCASAAKGNDVWYGMKGAAAPFLGARAMTPGFDGPAVLLGLLSHFAVSVVWGLMFGLLFFGLTKGATLLAGVGWGIVVWLGMYYVVLPAVGLGRMTTEAPILRVILYHVIFGLAVAVGFLPFQIHTRHDLPITRRIAGPRL